MKITADLAKVVRHALERVKASPEAAATAFLQIKEDVTVELHRIVQIISEHERGEELEDQIDGCRAEVEEQEAFVSRHKAKPESVSAALQRYAEVLAAKIYFDALQIAPALQRNRNVLFENWVDDESGAHLIPEWRDEARQYKQSWKNGEQNLVEVAEENEIVPEVTTVPQHKTPQEAADFVANLPFVTDHSEDDLGRKPTSGAAPWYMQDSGSFKPSAWKEFKKRSARDKARATKVRMQTWLRKQTQDLWDPDQTDDRTDTAAVSDPSQIALHPRLRVTDASGSTTEPTPAQNDFSNNLVAMVLISRQVDLPLVIPPPLEDIPKYEDLVQASAVRQTQAYAASGSEGGSPVLQEVDASHARVNMMLRYFEYNGDEVDMGDKREGLVRRDSGVGEVDQGRKRKARAIDDAETDGASNAPKKPKTKAIGVASDHEYTNTRRSPRMSGGSISKESTPDAVSTGNGLAATQQAVPQTMPSPQRSRPAPAASHASKSTTRKSLSSTRIHLGKRPTSKFEQHGGKVVKPSGRGRARLRLTIPLLSSQQDYSEAEGLKAVQLWSADLDLNYEKLANVYADWAAPRAVSPRSATKLKLMVARMTARYLR